MLFFNIVSAAADGDELELIVISEDIISLLVIVFVGILLMHTFVIKSRSVTKPCGLPSGPTTINELTFLSFIFFAASWDRSHFFDRF
jgi:hypothetical protein